MQSQASNYIILKRAKRVFDSLRLEYILKMRLRAKKVLIFDEWRLEAEWTSTKVGKFKLRKSWNKFLFCISKSRDEKLQKPIMKS